MVLREQALTMEQFQDYIQQPENEGKLFEFIQGEIIEVSPGRTSNSEYRDLIAVEVHIFCREQHLPCHTSGEAGAYRIDGQVVVPDFAYKPTPMSDKYPDPVPPLWVVEVVSPTDKASEIRAKREIYRAAGILYWELYADVQSIDVYPPGKPLYTVGIEGMLDGGDVLPGFQMAVKDLFR